MKALVTRSGLGSGSPPTTKEIETFDLYGPSMSTQGVQIAISLEAYTRLVNWASMGRTFDCVLNALMGAGDNETAYDALDDVRDALDECHQAVRRHWSDVTR